MWGGRRSQNPFRPEILVSNSAQEVISALFNDVLDERYRELVVQLCYNTQGSGFAWRPSDIDDMTMDEILYYMQRLNDLREGEAEAIKSGSSGGRSIDPKQAKRMGLIPDSDVSQDFTLEEDESW